MRVTELLAMLHFYGLPNAFITFGFDERSCSHFARVACAHAPGDLGAAARAPSTSASAFWKRAGMAEAAVDTNLLPDALEALGEGVEVWRQDE
jgi:hypothetical protein